MGKKLPTTPRSRVRAALRNLFLRSREHAACLKREQNTCQICKRKASKAKGKEFSVQVHHIDRIKNWDKIIDMIFEQLLCDPAFLQVLCRDCHDQEHADDKNIKEAT